MVYRKYIIHINSGYSSVFFLFFILVYFETVTRFQKFTVIFYFIYTDYVGVFDWFSRSFKRLPASLPSHLERACGFLAISFVIFDYYYYFFCFPSFRWRQGTRETGQIGRAHVRGDLLPAEGRPSRHHGHVRGTRDPEGAVRGARGPVQGDEDTRVRARSHRRRGVASGHVHGGDERRDRFARQVEIVEKSTASESTPVFVLKNQNGVFFFLIIIIH